MKGLAMKRSMLPPGGVIRRHRYDHQTGPEFRKSMADIRMSEGEFCRLTGTRERTLEKWLDEGPMYWATLFLHLMRDPGARAKAHTKANADIMSEDEYRALGAAE